MLSENNVIIMNLIELAKEKIVIFDGAMATNISRLLCRRNIPSERFCCSDVLNLYLPSIVLEVHREFIDAGCDVIETNTFNANRISLSGFGAVEGVHEINRRGVEIAKEAREGSDVLISGSVGPTPRCPSLFEISFEDLYDAYFEQIYELVVSGVDQIQIETVRDLLQAKAAIIAANDVFSLIGRRLPLIVSATVDAHGGLHCGADMGTFLSSLLPLGVDVIGVNCSNGPREIEEAVAYLSRHSPLPLLVMPNAGMPHILNGEPVYDVTPSEFGGILAHYVDQFGVEMVGGCCGTTPEHIRALSDSISHLKPKRRVIEML